MSILEYRYRIFDVDIEHICIDHCLSNLMSVLIDAINDKCHPLFTRATYNKLNTAGSFFNCFFVFMQYVLSVSHMCTVAAAVCGCSLCVVRRFVYGCVSPEYRKPSRAITRFFFLFFGGSSKKSLWLPLGCLMTPPPTHLLAKPGLAYELIQPQHQQKSFV